MAKKGKKEKTAPAETVEARDMEDAFLQTEKVEKAEKQKPVVEVVDVKVSLHLALEKEIIEIAGDRDPARVVWRVKTADNRETGTSLKYYMDCKKHEIETGTPCHFISLVGQPSQVLPFALKLVTPKVKKKCLTCP